MCLACSKDFKHKDNRPDTEIQRLAKDVSHDLRTIICSPSPIDLPDGCGCFPTASNCLITIVIEGSSQRSSFGTFTESIANDSLDHFFQGSSYRTIFPGLAGFPGYVTDLRNRRKTLVEVGSSKTDTRIFALVPWKKRSAFEESDIILAFPFKP